MSDCVTEGGRKASTPRPSYWRCGDATEHTCNDPYLIRAKTSFFSVVMMYEEKNLVRVKCDPKSVNAVIISALATFLQRWRKNLGMPRMLAIFDLKLELSTSVCATEGGRHRPPTRLEVR